MRILVTVMMIAAVFMTGPALAEVDLPKYRTCVQQHIDGNQPVTNCLHEAQAECRDHAANETPAIATLCFVEAKDSWSQGVKTRLEEISKQGDPQITAAAEIEVRYDLLANLLQCERMQELARLTDTDGSDIVLQNARCEATATALALTKLLVQSRNLK